MTISKYDKKNFKTLQMAWRHGTIALVESRDKAGHYVCLICAMQQNDDGTITPVPFAEMVRGNPFDLYVDPTVETLPEAVAEEH